MTDDGYDRAVARMRRNYKIALIFIACAVALALI